MQTSQNSSEKKPLFIILLVGNPFITRDQSKTSTLLFAKGEIFIKIGCQILNSFDLLKRFLKIWSLVINPHCWW
jgi:hypothetical protein